MSFSVFATLAAGLLSGLGVAIAAFVWALRRRHMHLWLPGYFRRARSVRPAYRAPRHADQKGSDKPLDLFIAVCDHYEPEWGRPGQAAALAKVERWRAEYPRQFGQFQDVDGRPPQHSFFFPQDEYRPEYLEVLGDLCRAGYGDVDVHLHHDADTAAGLREKLELFKLELYHRHGLLRRDPRTGEIVYGFIHGNWALCNSRPDGRWCGVDQELTVLRETGCYADFTLPSAPSNTQTSTINSIYYAADRPGRCKSHDHGTPATVGQAAPANHLLMIQGPLLPDWSRPKFGVLPRIENGDIHAGRPASWSRLQNWIRAGVHVAGRPEWVFVKLHTHGCKDGNIDAWLGNESQQFHRDLAVHAGRNANFRYHYVTAWEMAQLVRQAEAGSTRPNLLAIRAGSTPSQTKTQSPGELAGCNHFVL